MPIQRRSANDLHSILRARLMLGARAVVVDDFARGVFAMSAALGNRQMALHGAQRVGAALNGFPDLAIGDVVADTNVHMSDERT
jgi:hypothetical protein